MPVPAKLGAGDFALFRHQDDYDRARLFGEQNEDDVSQYLQWLQQLKEERVHYKELPPGHFSSVPHAA
jgi:uncharacterized cupin superfamily protein